MSASIAMVLLAIQVGIRVTIGVDTIPESQALVPGGVEVDSALLASAYLDPGAERLIRLARARQDSSDHSIFSYRSLARQRISVGLSTLRRERLIYRRESAARLHWRRYGRHEVEVLGAREVLPIALSEEQVPEDLRRTMPFFLFDPSDHHLFAVSQGGNQGNRFRHPLEVGSEVHYRFESGDTTSITLPDGRSVNLVEVRLHPRRPDPRLVSGSLWLEAERYAVVQGVFRLARPFDLERDIDPAEAEDIRFLPGLFKPIRAEFRYLTVEYGLWEMEWWLPRLVALEGVATIGKLFGIPIRYELTYSDYEIAGDPVQMPLDLPIPKLVMTIGGEVVPAPQCRRGVDCRCYRGECWRVDVRVPADSSLLLTHPELPPSIYSSGSELVDDDEVRSILGRLAAASSPSEFVGPELYWGLSRPGLIRYNRVEGLSTGVGLGIEYGAMSAELIGRVAWSDLRHPSLSLGAEWAGPRYRTRLGVYHDLASVDRDARPFGLGNSLSALLWGQDDGDYYRALGIDLAGGPVSGRGLRFDWRVYAERQDPVSQMTRVSLRRLWDSGNPFRPNFEIDQARLIGGEIGLNLAHGLDPNGFRWRGIATIDGAVGSHRFIRPSTTLTLIGPLGGPLLGSIEGGVGTAIGELPAQGAWFLGGSTTLRGYAPLAVGGESFWRARVEVGAGVPLGRVIAFSDLGWAGARAIFPGQAPLASVGLGGSLLDGLVRLDLARALRAPTGWRLTLAADLAL